MAFPQRHIVLISGFSQTSETAHGLIKLSWRLWEAVKGRGAMLWTPPQTWRMNIESALGYLQNAGNEARVFVVGYSYGGNLAVQLVRALERRGIHVPFLVLIDPVRRWDRIPGFAAALGWFRLFRNLFPFEIPPNVCEVCYYYQTRRWPFGFPVVARDPARTRIVSKQIHVGHVDMDDVEEIHELVVCLADRFLCGDYNA